MRVVSAMAGLALALTAGCSAGSTAPPAATRATASPAPGACPALLHAAAPQWPSDTLASVPRIPAAVLGSVTHTQGITYVHFTTKESLRDGVLILLRSLRTAGFVVGRGDSEATEADAPFASATLLGSVRLTVLDTCSTGWLLAVVSRTDATTRPLIPPHAHNPSVASSPLPLG